MNFKIGDLVQLGTSGNHYRIISIHPPFIDVKVVKLGAYSWGYRLGEEFYDCSITEGKLIKPIVRSHPLTTIFKD